MLSNCLLTKVIKNPHISKNVGIKDIIQDKSERQAHLSNYYLDSVKSASITSSPEEVPASSVAPLGASAPGAAPSGAAPSAC